MKVTFLDINCLPHALDWRTSFELGLKQSRVIILLISFLLFLNASFFRFFSSSIPIFVFCFIHTLSSWFFLPLYSDRGILYEKNKNQVYATKPVQPSGHFEKFSVFYYFLSISFYPSSSFFCFSIFLRQEIDFRILHG
jgi:hypothetical protein